MHFDSTTHMTTAALLVIALCAIVLTVVFVPTLAAVRAAARRAETVLMLLEREIRPTAGQLQALADELRGLSRHAGEELDRVRAMVSRVENLTTRIAHVLGVVGGVAGFVGGFTRVGRVVETATGVKKGLDVFIRKLVSKDRRH